MSKYNKNVSLCSMFGIKDSISQRCLFSPKLSIDSVQFQYRKK